MTQAPPPDEPPDEPPADGAAGPVRAGRRRPGRPVLRAAALLLVGGLLGGVAVVAATRQDGRAAPVSRGAVAGPAQTPAGLAPAALAPALDASTPKDATALPVSIDIPKMRTKSPLVDLHLDLDGTLQVPQDYGVAGWYSDGPLPGDADAPAVVVGHVDSKKGPGIFYQLSSLTAGDAVLITRADGSQLRFQVYAAADYPKDAFPAEQVYAATTQPELRLITCTGTFDRAAARYLSNRVVYARQAPAPAG